MMSLKSNTLMLDNTCAVLRECVREHEAETDDPMVLVGHLERYSAELVRCLRAFYQSGPIDVGAAVEFLKKRAAERKEAGGTQ